MKIVFVIPTAFNSLSKIMPGRLPLGVLYIASYIRNKDPNLRIKIIDCVTDKLSLDETIKILKKERPDIVGITIMTHLVMEAKALSKKIKLHMPDCVTVAGGLFANARPKELLTTGEFDYVVVGEAEPSFYNLCQFLKHKIPKKSLSGVFFLDNGTMVGKQSNTLIKELDTIPFPARDLIDQNKYFPLEGEKSTSILTSRGCPYNCIYCTHKMAFGKRIRRRSVENVLSELHECINRYGIHNYEFVDSLFLSSKSYAQKLCEAIISTKLNIKWGCQTRIDSLIPTDAWPKEKLQNLLFIMKRSGCHSIFFGIDSGSQRILNINKKSQDLKTVRPVIDSVKKAGIRTEVNFVLGLLGETKETLKETFEFSKKINADRIYYNRAWAYPGTVFYEELVRTNSLHNKEYWKNPDSGISIIAYEGFNTHYLESILRKQLIKERFSLRNIVRIFRQLGTNPSISNLNSVINSIRRFLIKVLHPHY